MFDRGFHIGRFFVSWIINDLFCGFAFRFGKECELNVYHITIQLGYGQLSMGLKGDGV